jgi:hypothetical protein
MFFKTAFREVIMESAKKGSGWTKLRRSAKLIAPGSPRQAWYSLTLYQLPYDNGFVVEKRSGSKGSKGTNEMWYRSSLVEAEKKFNAILRSKTGKNGPRQYIEVAEFEPAPNQFDLWP